MKSVSWLQTNKSTNLNHSLLNKYLQSASYTSFSNSIYNACDKIGLARFSKSTTPTTTMRKPRENSRNWKNK